MARSENQCIRKTSLKTGYSKIHIGNNQWKHTADKGLYPKIMATIASEFCELVEGQSSPNQHTRQRIIDRVIPFLDYMAGEGYCNSNNRNKVKTVLQQFRELVRELKLIIYDTTKSKN